MCRAFEACSDINILGLCSYALRQTGFRGA